MRVGKSFVIAMSMTLASASFGQTTGVSNPPQDKVATPSNTAKPSPATPAAAPQKRPYPPITDTNAYPYQKALEVIQGKQDAAPSVPSVSQAASGATSSSVVLHRQPPTQGTRQLASLASPAAPLAPLSASAARALAISDAAKLDDAMPTPGKDGRVTYTFGTGLPTIVCSPLHVSIVELEPGESINGEPAIGDSIRWEIMPGSSGQGSDLEPLVMIKPHQAGLDTNLVIATNKRTYYLRLVSRENEYIARTAFSYKEDEDKRWKQYLEKQNQEKQDRENAQVVTRVAGNAIDNLNFEYDIKGGNAVIRPIRVMDDGEKTYITMPDAVLHQDLPALVVLNPRLKKEKAEEIVNYRVKGNLYIVDRLFDQAALLIGSGKAVDKVVIKRRSPLAGGGR
jgi:type IV secretion system protein VirB9